MLTPKALEAWYILMAEATRGSAGAQEAFQSLSKMSGNPDDMNRWMAQFMPGAVSSATRFTPDAFEDQLEDWWRLMGVVPRARYLDLLEKCDTLQRKLDKAEETIEKLRKRAGGSSQPGGEETKQVLDMWSSMMGETLKTQNEWMKAWTAANSSDTERDEESAGETGGSA